jgi:hypothetical protein
MVTAAVIDGVFESGHCDDPGAWDEVAALRTANAWLRQVIEAKNTEIAALRVSHQAQLDVLRAQVEALAAEVAELRAGWARTHGTPPSRVG